MVSVNPRKQTIGEEIANAASHAMACLLAVASLPILLDFAARKGDAAEVVGVGVFAVTMILLYLVSALYHALPPGPAKAWLHRLDHAAISLFMAGSTMPFALGLLQDGAGWAVILLVWVAAGLGMVVKLAGALRHRVWSTTWYVAMGWLALMATAPLLERIGDTGLTWLAAGCAAYTVGAVVFLFDDRMRYGHLVWHLLVMLGSACHVLAVIGQAA